MDDCSNSGHIICLAEEGGNLPMKNDLHVLFVPFDTSGFREVFYYVHSKIPANMVNQVSHGYIIVGTDLLPAEYCRDHVPQGMPHRPAHPTLRHWHRYLTAELGVCCLMLQRPPS